MAVCYRHPNRETGVSCSSCGRAICPDCMTPTPVGMRCPECARDRTKVRTVRSVPTAPVATQVLIALNVIFFLAETATGAQLGGVSGTGGTVFNHFALFGPAISSAHQYYRLLTAGFLHDGIIHIGVNMLSLYFVGRVLEPAIGRVNFLAIYFTSLLAGSFGALLFQPLSPTVGASTAIFGIFGALIVVAYYRGIPIWQSGLGPILILNLVLSVSYAGISLGGHLGGLIAGAVTGWLVVQYGERRHMPAVALGACALIAVLSIIGGIAVAGGHGIAPNGICFGS